MKKFIVLGVISFAVLFFSGCGIQTTKTTTTDSPAQEKKVALSVEGGSCTADVNCETGLKCITSKCSSGQVGSVCATYKDCGVGLFCKKSICSNPPSYAKYFSKISISKMKQGQPPGPNNVPFPTTEFRASTDAIEIDFAGKAGTNGEVYYEIVDSTTGETILSIANNKMKIDERGGGMGMSIPNGAIGNFELNIYFNNELIYTETIKIN